MKDSNGGFFNHFFCFYKISRKLDERIKERVALLGLFVLIYVSVTLESCRWRKQMKDERQRRAAKGIELQNNVCSSRTLQIICVCFVHLYFLCSFIFLLPPPTPTPPLPPPDGRTWLDFLTHSVGTAATWPLSLSIFSRLFFASQSQ